jgi:organic radical activating enzyme
MCCASREKASWATQYLDSESADNESVYNPISLEEHWNSDYMKGIRKDLMMGKTIPQCEVCNDKLLNVSIYRDYFNKTLFPNKIDEAFEKTNDDGHTEMVPISFDYRITNLCNFKCRMCGDQLSSQWEAERRSMGQYDLENNNDLWAQKKNKQVIEVFQKEVAEKELWEAVKNGTIEEIYWVGGEPLMWEIHWEIMDYLVKSGGAKNVWIRYNTNFSRTTYKQYDLRDMLPHFKMVQICASIDGTGEIVEYVRHGIKWNEWISNFKDFTFLNQKYGRYGIAFDLTITTPGLFSLKDLFDLSLELDVETLIKTTFAFDGSIIMCPQVLPRDLYNEVIDDIIEYIKPKIADKPKYNYWIVCLQDLKNRETFQEKYPDWRESLQRGLENLKRVDKWRNNEGVIEKIFSVNPKVLEWWKNANEKLI